MLPINRAHRRDKIGNRVQDQNGQYLYDAKKQLLTEDYRYRYFYDGNGNLSSKVSKLSSETINFLHNSENQLIKIEWYDGASKIKEVAYTTMF